MSSLKAFWDFISEVGKNHPRLNAYVLWSLLMTLIWPIIIPLIPPFSGTRWNDHVAYLIFKDPLQKQKDLGIAVDRMNKLINEQEYLSFNNQQQLVDAITYAYDVRAKKDSREWECPIKALQLPDCFSVMLRANSNTHEFIRSFLQINDVYIRLLRSGFDDGSVHRFIDDFYISSNRLLKTQPRCEDVYPSYSTLRSLHNRIDIISPDVRDSLNMEVLRLLTFSAAFLELKCKSTAPQGAYLESLDIYNRRASEIVNRSFKNPTNSLYLRKLFWLDFSKLVAEQNKLKIKDPRQIVKYYSRLESGLPPEFLRSKLEQNKNVTISR